MKLNLRRFNINKLTVVALIFTLVFAQLGLIFPSHAAPTFEISPSAVSGSASKRITVTSDEDSFTVGESTPYIMQKSAVVGEASISSVDSQSDEVSFTLGAGLSNGDYDVRIVDPKGTYDVGTITVGDPSVDSISPESIANEYSNQEIIVTGINTNFEMGKTTVEILNSQDQVVDYVDSITEVNSNESLSFMLKDGLSSGIYSIRVSTDDEILTASDVLEVRGTADIDISPISVNEGYSSTTINVTGTDTGFSSTQTTVSIVGESNVVGTVNVVDENNLSFSLNSGLESGTYTVEVRTENEETQTTLTVNEASMQVRYQGSNLDEIPVGYTSPYSLVLSGTNTSFQSGTTQISIYDGNPDGGGNDVTSSYITNTNVSSSTSISFQLGTGLETGTYYITAVTGNQEVQDTFTVVSPEISSVDFNSDVVSGSKVPEGYEKMTVEITGQDTLFMQGTTTVEIQGETDKTQAVNVEDSTHLSFSLNTGLDAGSHTIVVDIDGDESTSSDQATHQFTVTSPEISSVSPNNIINASSTPITITVIGDDTHFTSATPNIDILGESNEVISNINVISDTKLTFKLTPDSISTSGDLDIEITTSGSYINEEVTASSAITVGSSGISISPASVYEDELGTEEIIVTGYNTNFVSNDTTVMMDNNSISGVEVNSTTQLSFTIPNESYLTEGTHTVKVIDGSSDTYTTSILVDSRSISISPDEKNFEYDSFTMTVNGQGVTFNTTDKKPQVSISNYGSVAINDSDINTTYFTFDFPAGLEAGSYTVTVFWNDLNLTDTITIDNITSDIYFKHGGIKKSTVNIDESEETITLEAWSELIGSGDDTNITSNADWNVESGSDVVSVNNSGVVTLKNTGSAVVSVTYDGVQKDINIVVAGEEAILQDEAELTGIAIDQSNPTVDIGSVIQLTVTAHYSDQSTEDNINSATWQSDNLSVATVGYNSGTVSGVSDGTATITVSYEDETDSIQVTVNQTEDTQTDEEVDETPDSGSEGGVGGGGTGSVPTLPSEEVEKTLERETGIVRVIQDGEGRKQATVDVDEDKVKDILKDRDQEVATIDATTGENADRVEVGMKADIISTANENNKPILVEGDNVSFRIEPGTIDVDGDGEEVSLSSTQLSYEEMKDKLPKAEGEADAVSLVYDFNLSVGENKVTNFNKPMTITIDIDMSKIEDKDKVGVYYFNETDNQWEYVGGKVDTGGTITFAVDHFSTYTAMEYNKTFEDISNHWAKEAIEKMAGRHIAKGIAEDEFAPDQSITRAEFAALIIRALDIGETSDSVDFGDIDEGAWYKEVVSKAYEAGIVSGTEDNKFAPNDNITREQMATMIMRAYEYASGTNLGDIVTTMEIRFNDEGTASSWARRNIILSNAKGFMNGFPDESFRPKANATRAQAIVVIKKLLVELDVISE